MKGGRFLALGAVVCVGIVIARALVPSSGKDLIHRLNVGHVKPGEEAKGHFVIRNDRHESVLLQGFEEACGVEPDLAGNPILLSGERRILTLRTRANRRPGPAGAGLEIRFVGAKTGRIESASYMIAYEVDADPWIEPAELWIDETNSQPIELKVEGCPRNAVISVIGRPDDLDVATIGTTLRVAQREDTKRDSGPLHVQVSAGKRSWNLEVPVMAAAPKRIVRFYPSIVYWATPLAEHTVMRLVGDCRLVDRIDCTCSKLKATLKGDKVVVESLCRDTVPDRAILSLVSKQGVKLDTAEIVMGDRR